MNGRTEVAVEPTNAPVPARAPWIAAATLAGTYFLIAGAYVYLSSTMAGATAMSVEELERIELMKGLTFIGVTAVTLFVMNLVQLRALRAHQDDRLRRDRVLHNAERNILAGTFARGVAHDINNGLAVAMMSLEELRRHVHADVEAMTLADEVQQGLLQIKEWNRRFFDLGSQRLLGEEGEFDLAHSLRQTAKLARRHDHVRDAQLETDLPDTAIIRGREALVQRAVLNLILNAAEAAGPGKRVLLTLSKTASGRWRVTVDDTGPGIPFDDRKRVLEPFHTSKPEGTGLGLTSVVACASMHGSTVSIEDSPLGGARFAFELRG